MFNNQELQQYFLDMIKEFLISNPDKNIDSNFIYSQLMYFNIKNSQGIYQDIESYFEEWKNYFDSNQNIKVFQVPERKCFLWFSKGEMRGNEIKLYIPLDKEHIKEGANQLFNFISTTNIEHQSKIANRIRNDNIVVRVNSLEDAKTIIDYVSHNHFLKEGMIKVNPFLPTCNGVGITMDNSYSFNSTLSKIICDFLNELKKINRLDLFTVIELNKYIKAKANNIFDLDLRDIYLLLEKTTDPNFKLKSFVDHVNNKLIDKYSKRNRITDPKFYFEQAITITAKVHPKNSKIAILEYLKGNPNYFTNQQRARDGIIKYVHPGDVINLMRTKLRENNIEIPNNDQELVEKYLGILLEKQNNELVVAFEILKTAYLNTLKIYGQRQATVAIQTLLLTGERKYFTNQFQDRDKLKDLMIRHDIKKIILSNISLENLNVNDIYEIVNRFEETIDINIKNSQNVY